MKGLKTAARFLPAIGWYAVIWAFSAQTGAESGEVSKWVLTDAFHFDIYRISWSLYQLLTFLVRKCAHLAVYFVLAGLLYWAFSALVPRILPRMGATLLVTAAFAVSDELHQYFVPGRSCQLRDVLVDAAGGLLFLLLWGAFILLRRRRKPKEDTP